MCICQSQSPNLSLSPYPLVTISLFLHLWLYFCSVNKFVCTLFFRFQKSVLKCTWDFVFIQVWWGQQIRRTTEKIACYSQFLREGGTLHHTGLHGEAPGLVRGIKEQGESTYRSFSVVFTGKEGWGKINIWAGLGLDSLNNFAGVWAVVVQCGTRLWGDLGQGDSVQDSSVW